MHHYDVPKKVMEGRSCWGRLGMRIFFRRYKLLESANFPWKTPTTFFSVVALAGGIYLVIEEEATPALWELGICLIVMAILFVFCLTFLFTAPTIGRITFIRRSYLVVVDKVLCQFMESIQWCTGTNKTGYMMHLTAQKLLHYGYISPEEFTDSCTMAIVRNPYSRMVSVYNYNKFGDAENFKAFVKDWHGRMYEPYRETCEMEEWYVPCHVIPQMEFTHSRGCQLVRSVVKQEELKFLKTKEGEEQAKQQDSTVSDLPELVRSALLGMPHTNARASSKKWFEYYDQETLDLVYDMYEKDFAVFNYSPVLTQRPELKPPKTYDPEALKKILITDFDEERAGSDELFESVRVPSAFDKRATFASSSKSSNDQMSGSNKSLIFTSNVTKKGQIQVMHRDSQKGSAFFQSSQRSLINSFNYPITPLQSKLKKCASYKHNKKVLEVIESGDSEQKSGKSEEVASA